MRRVAFYLFFDPHGQVDGYVLHTLRHLRAHAEHIFVVSNAGLDDAGRDALRGVADQVWERDNVGFDVGAYHDALTEFGAERLAEYDELILLNSTFFGPVGSFEPLFTAMAARDVDFWGVTEHGATRKHAFDPSRPMPAHLQSHWIAVRRAMFTGDDWAEYWGTMPEIRSYVDSVVHHESRFTPWFEARGYTSAVAFPAEDYGSKHPILLNPVQMVRDGCPIVKRRSFFHNPMFHEAKANDGRQLARLMAERGYPMDLMLSNLARTARPRWLATNLGLLEILPEVDLGYDRARPLRVVAITHVFYPEMTEEILDRLEHLPHDYDLVVTTSDAAKAAVISGVLARRGRAADVRVVRSNRGRDVSAFFVDCRDVLESDDYDVVVKVHSKRQPQDPPNVQELFKRHMFENLLSSPGYAANVLRLFQQYSSLGMVFPPVYHIAYPTLGRAWFLNKPRAEEEAQRLGIHVPFDDNTPLSAYGSFFVARPEALRKITSAGYRHEDFPDETDYRDGALTHVVERLVSYAALSEGYHCREVMNAELAAINYNYLEYRAIVLAAKLPALPVDQVKRIRKLKQIRKTAIRAGLIGRGTGGRALETTPRRRRWGRG